VTAPTDIDRYVEAHRQEHLDRLFAYLRIPGISAHGAGMAESAEHALGLLRGAGLNARLCPTVGAPFVYGEALVDPARPTLLIYGHYDVQPADPLDLWHSPPFEPTIRNGRIYARGVADNRGQHLAHILGLEAWRDCRGTLPLNVKVLLEGEEEVGSPRMPGFVADSRDLLRADVCVISDGGVDDSGRSVIRFGVRGVLSFELRARGAARDLHSGHWGEIAPNPIWTLVRLLATMKNGAGVVTIDGFGETVAPLSAEERAALAAMEGAQDEALRSIGLSEMQQHPARTLGERRAGWPSFTISGLHGGYGGPGSKTVLPCEAFAKCDIRLVPDQRADDVLAMVRRHVARHAPGVEVISHGAMEPSKTPLDSPYAAPVRRAIARVDGTEPMLLPAMGGSLPEYPFTHTLGIPCLGVPFANADEANHAPNENMEVKRFHRGIRIAAALLEEIAASSPSS